MYWKATSVFIGLLLLCTPGYADISSDKQWDQVPKPLVTDTTFASRYHKVDGWANVRVETNRYGYVIAAELLEASNDNLGRDVVDSIRRWRYSPAREDNKDVAAEFIQPIRINSGIVLTEEKTNQTRDPVLLHKEYPIVPEELLRVDGWVNSTLDLDAEGNVVAVHINESSHKEFENITLDALKQWRFKPAYKNGLPIQSRVIVPVVFMPNPGFKSTVDIAPIDQVVKPIRQPSPRIPTYLKNVRGTVELAFTVDEFGYATDARIINTTHPDLAKLAMETIERWKFRPAMRNGKPVATRVLQPFTFSGGLVVTASKEKIDRFPTVRKTVAPKVPKELEDVDGYVLIQFTIDKHGNVIDAEAKDASHTELEDEAIIAAKKWKFRPAIKMGQAQESTVMVPFVYGRS